MHPEIIRAVAEQRIEQWLATAEADRRARQTKATKSPTTQSRIMWSRRPRLLLGRRRVVAECPAVPGA